MNVLSTDEVNKRLSKLIGEDIVKLSYYSSRDYKALGKLKAEYIFKAVVKYIKKTFPENKISDKDATIVWSPYVADILISSVRLRSSANVIGLYKTKNPNSAGIPPWTFNYITPSSDSGVDKTKFVVTHLQHDPKALELVESLDFSKALEKSEKKEKKVAQSFDRNQQEIIVGKILFATLINPTNITKCKSLYAIIKMAKDIEFEDSFKEKYSYTMSIINGYGDQLDTTGKSLAAEAKLLLGKEVWDSLANSTNTTLRRFYIAHTEGSDVLALGSLDENSEVRKLAQIKMESENEKG